MEYNKICVYQYIDKDVSRQIFFDLNSIHVHKFVQH